MPHFADRLIAAMEQKKSCVVVGLDPRIERLPPELKQMAGNSREDAAQAMVEFNRGILEAVAPSAVAVKPQAAFYEALGFAEDQTVSLGYRILNRNWRWRTGELDLITKQGDPNLL